VNVKKNWILWRTSGALVDPDHVVLWQRKKFLTVEGCRIHRRNFSSETRQHWRRRFSWNDEKSCSSWRNSCRPEDRSGVRSHDGMCSSDVMKDGDTRSWDDGKVLTLGFSPKLWTGMGSKLNDRHFLDREVGDV